MDNRDEGVAGPRAVWRIIRRRDFGPYFLGNALSASGTWFQNLAAALLIYRLTHSALLLGVLNFSQFIPILVLTPWAGSLADRLDRRKLLLVSQSFGVVLAAGLAALAWGGLATTWVVIADTLCLGVVSAFSAPGQQALIVSLVRRDEVPTAVALNSMTFNLARALGPAGAALSVHYLGIPASFALNAASYGIFIAALVVVRPRRQQRATREQSRVRDSFRLLRQRPELAAFLLIVAIVGFASDPVNTLSPAFAHAYGKPDTWAGFIVGAFGAGAVTAALIVAGRVAGSRWRMAATLFLLGAGVAAFSVCPWLPLGCVQHRLSRPAPIREPAGRRDRQRVERPRRGRRARDPSALGGTCCHGECSATASRSASTRCRQCSVRSIVRIAPNPRRALKTISVTRMPTLKLSSVVLAALPANV